MLSWLFLWALWTIYSASVEAAAEGLDPGQPQLLPSIEAGLLAFLAAFAMAQAIRLLREGPRPRAAGRGRRR